jgi:hypothetical protein
MPDNRNGPPIEVEGRTPHHQGQPSTNAISSHHTTNTDERSAYCVGLSRRRSAARRMVGGDPWWFPPPGKRGYAQAAAHLLEVGLTPAADIEGLRSMYRQGGNSRQVAEFIAERWDLVA